MTSSSLSAATLAQVSDRLEGFGSSLHGDHREALKALLEALEAGLTGTLEAAYHLSAIDPGIGKTLSVATFLQTWKARGFSPSSSVLIGLSRLQEIDAYLKEAGLDREDVAVLTSSDECNDLGVPRDQHASARVMFTTQQMIEKRTRGRTFAEANEFNYEGRPRALRIWDESLIPAEPLVLKADDLACLPAALRRQSPELVPDVQALLVQLWTPAETMRVLIPESLAAASGVVRSLKNQQTANTLEKLSRLAGQHVAVVQAGTGDIDIVGAAPPLPSDFLPVIILDASGRVRSTYGLWERAGGPLRSLPPAVKDYSNLRINLWDKRPVGLTTIASSGTIEDVVNAVADEMDDDPASNWLIVTYKDHPIDKMLREALKEDVGDRLHFLTWGMHHGTNAYEHCKKVVLIGQLTYSTSGYRALAAACGAASVDEAVEQELKVGEYRHHLLQALTRASVRRNRNGVAGTCTAYVIASPNAGTGDLLPEVFPGCTIEAWVPDVPEVGGRAGELISLLADATRRRDSLIRKKDLREALNIKAPNLTRLLRHRDVSLWMEERHIREERFALILPARFDPYPGGGFMVDDLEASD